MTRVAVVVLNWNGISDTLQCLDSLQRQVYKDFSIIVVDNGSVDDSAAQLKHYQKTHKNTTVLYNDKNLGFAGGVNTGIRHALANKFDAIALLNNDATADSKWLVSLVESLQQKEIGIGTGLLLHEDGKTIDSSGDWYTSWGLPFPRSRNQPTGSAESAGYVFSASGGASLYRASLFQDIGLFDESFFAYYEDTDMSFRAQLAGYRIAYSPEAIAYHKRGATSARMPGFTVYQTMKNLPLLFLKNVPGPLLLLIGGRFCLAYVLFFGNTIRRGNGVAAVKGLLKAIILIPHALQARRAVQKNRKVTADYINDLIIHDLPPDQTGLRKFRSLFIGK